MDNYFFKYIELSKELMSLVKLIFPDLLFWIQSRVSFDDYMNYNECQLCPFVFKLNPGDKGLYKLLYDHGIIHLEEYRLLIPFI